MLFLCQKQESGLSVHLINMNCHNWYSYFCNLFKNASVKTWNTFQHSRVFTFVLFPHIRTPNSRSLLHWTFWMLNWKMILKSRWVPHINNYGNPDIACVKVMCEKTRECLMFATSISYCFEPWTCPEIRWIGTLQGIFTSWGNSLAFAYSFALIQLYRKMEVVCLDPTMCVFMSVDRLRHYAPARSRPESVFCILYFLSWVGFY